jgi:hypothetical protein
VATRWLRLFGVPQITAYSLGVFRAVLGFGFLLILLFADPIIAVPLDLQQAYSPLADVDWVHRLAASETGTFTLQVIGCVSALLFALGIWARPSFAVLVPVLLIHATLLLVRRGVHDWDLPIVTLIALLAVPWGAAPSVFNLRSDSSQTSRAYGFAVWLPGLTIGLAFAAAAYAKMQTSGLDWITSGAVRYHFVDDGHNAPVDLGLWIATQPALAVVLSALVVLIEASFIVVIFMSGWRARAVFGLVGAALMGGFYLFQGVHWWPWLILFAAFLPWNRIAPAHAVDGHRDLTWVHGGVVATLVATQAWASYRAIEIEPLLSNYPMYSITYQSPEHFEYSHGRPHFEAEGSDITDRVVAAGGANTVQTIAERQRQGAAVGPELASALADFGGRYAALFGTAPAAVDAVLWVEPFDWQAGRYLPPAREHMGTVQLSALTPATGDR